MNSKFFIVPRNTIESKFNLNFPLILQLKVFKILLLKYFSEVIMEVSELGGFIGERRMVKVVWAGN